MAPSLKFVIVYLLDS